MSPSTCARHADARLLSIELSCAGMQTIEVVVLKVDRDSPFLARVEVQRPEGSLGSEQSNVRHALQNTPVRLSRLCFLAEYYTK